jgi:hypothetical protein
MPAVLARIFACDLRSLAALRIALGLLLLADLTWRIPYFSTWYSEAGAWPIASARSDRPHAWSLYFLSGSTAWTIALLITSTASALALLLGWKTRVATVLCWILLVSLQARNELPLNAGDTVLRLLLFWGAFLPLGSCWSADARRHPRAGQTTSVATAALLVQVALIYVFNALYKTGASWAGGTAIAKSLSQETYATSLGEYLLQWPALLSAGTHATWWLELCAPVLVFLPWRPTVFRTVIPLAMMAFHLGLFLTLRIGLFPIICMAAWLPFLPPAFWDRLRLRTTGEPPARTPIAVQISCAVLLAALLTVNILPYAKIKPPDWFRRSVVALRLEQRWSLFAPDLPTSEGWMIVVVESDEGTEYNALTGDPVDWTRPANLRQSIPTAQWRKFLAAVRSQRYPERVRQFAAWAARQWQQQNPDREMRRVRVHYLWEYLAKRTNPPEHWFIYEKPPGPLLQRKATTSERTRFPVFPVREAQRSGQRWACRFFCKYSG